MKIFSMDAHMHFDLYNDRDYVVNYIESEGSYTIAVTNLPVLFERYYQDYQQYKYMKVALGFHPELAHEYQEQLPVFIRNIDKTRYIGEIGLDFSTQDLDNRETQMKVFSEIVRKCNEKNGKILSVHSRKAQKEVLKVLENFQGKVILHWYSGTAKDLKEAINRGYYFSINHQMIRNASGKKIDAIPINKILIESDAPFTRELSEKYDLFFVNDVYVYLAKSRQLTIDEISTTIKNNFKKILQ
jgi:TatD DNase family protein